MDARDMHYDFKQKLNKVDSQKYRNLKVPEIDWKLNEAQEVFVKTIAQPRLGKKFGFEFNQRSIDDIRTIVVNQKPEEGIVLSQFDDKSYIAKLPNNYWFYANGKLVASKGVCKDKKLRLTIVQHDDEAETSAFDRSSFEWRKANIRFIREGIRVFTDGTFTPSKLILDYLIKPRLIHNAQDWVGGSYKLGGQTLSGTQSCELPETVHRDIVDLAVLITTGDLNLSNYQIKQHKLNLTS